nr:DUF2599 domain-containing protein [Gordonia shandongensis]
MTVAACGTDAADDVTAPTTRASASESVPPTSNPAASSATPSTTPVLPPPYIASLSWVQTEVGPSLQIVPTRNGRDVSSPTAGDEAWREVLDREPGADTPGMKEQFDCHWTFARLIDPEKPSWNLEPDRPVVSPDEMIATRCNPGGPEE